MTLIYCKRAHHTHAHTHTHYTNLPTITRVYICMKRGRPFANEVGGVGAFE